MLGWPSCMLGFGQVPLVFRVLCLVQDYETYNIHAVVVVVVLFVTVKEASKERLDIAKSMIASFDVKSPTRQTRVVSAGA